MRLSDKRYDILKFLCQIGLPATGACYFGLSQIWGFPYAEEIVGTISVICTFIGAILGISGKVYWSDKEILEKEI